MVYELIWLPAVLRNAGLKVAPVDGWGAAVGAHIGPIAGIICHQTATTRERYAVNARVDTVGSSIAHAGRSSKIEDALVLPGSCDAGKSKQAVGLFRVLSGRTRQ